MKKLAIHTPTIVMVLLFALGAITNDTAWTYAGFAWGVFCWGAVVGIFIIARRERRS